MFKLDIIQIKSSSFLLTLPVCVTFLGVHSFVMYCMRISKAVLENRTLPPPSPESNHELCSNLSYSMCRHCGLSMRWRIFAIHSLWEGKFSLAHPSLQQRLIRVYVFQSLDLVWNLWNSCLTLLSQKRVHVLTKRYEFDLITVCICPLHIIFCWPLYLFKSRFYCWCDF